MLEVKLPGEAPRRLRFDWQDVVLLRAFLKGSDRYEAGEDSERALGEEVSRLRSLLLGDNPSRGEDGGE